MKRRNIHFPVKLWEQAAVKATEMGFSSISELVRMAVIEYLAKQKKEQ